LNAHWHALAVGDVNAEHDIYDDNTICDYPQPGVANPWVKQLAGSLRRQPRYRWLE